MLPRCFHHKLVAFLQPSWQTSARCSQADHPLATFVDDWIRKHRHPLLQCALTRRWAVGARVRAIPRSPTLIPSSPIDASRPGGPLTRPQGSWPRAPLGQASSPGAPCKKVPSVTSPARSWRIATATWRDLRCATRKGLQARLRLG